eukprot:COSAG05_NODE_9699_length_607_cov_1.312992_1_plen_47_part_10
MWWVHDYGTWSARYILPLQRSDDTKPHAVLQLESPNLAAAQHSDSYC